MKAVEWRSDLGKEFEGSIHLVVRALHRVGIFKPRKYFRSGAEWIAPCAAEGMPVGDGKPEVFFHGFFSHFF
jgi:hypothetical protein